MWSQLKGARRNVILFPLVIFIGLIVYSVFILRGRCCGFNDGTDDLLLQVLTRCSHADHENPDYNKPSKHLSYTLTELTDGHYERKITNLSWRPFLVTMYEFEDWRYNLPDEMLLRYASRYVVRNNRTDLEIDSGIGFDCGSGLGMTLIRPWETFVDTVGFEEITPDVYLRHQLRFLKSGYAHDLLTGTQIGDPLQGKLDQYDGASLLTMVPDDALEVRLYLPVADYFTGEPARVYADGFTVRRWELLGREVARRAEIEAEFAN
jgi:hypothetical protein